MTVVWYVDDFKASHKYPDDTTKLVSWLKLIYGVSKLHRREKHDYLRKDLISQQKGNYGYQWYHTSAK